MAQEFSPIDGFSCAAFAYGGYEYPLYQAGTGPAVVVIHEVPGITPAVIRFARYLIKAGFSVYMPSLFGTVGRGYDPINLATQLARACISKEFAALSRGQSSPVTNFVRGVCLKAHAEQGGIGVGAIGMCMTGNFALGLMVDPVVMAPVLSQPSLPIGLGKARADMHVSKEELRKIKVRFETEDVKLLGLRFTHDAACPKARFDSMRNEFGDSFEAIEIDSSLGNKNNLPISAHSVLTKDLVNKAGHPTRNALERTITFLHEQLKTGRLPLTLDDAFFDEARL